MDRFQRRIRTTSLHVDKSQRYLSIERLIFLSSQSRIQCVRSQVVKMGAFGVGRHTSCLGEPEWVLELSSWRFGDQSHETKEIRGASAHACGSF
jgi:hypothetical protein